MRRAVAWSRDDAGLHEVERRLLRAVGGQENLGAYSSAYALTDEGISQAQEGLRQSGYAGPAPVALADFIELVHRQKINNVVVTFDKIRAAFGELAISDVFIEKIGPALNSDRAILLYGPPGNGKTSVALCFADIFNDIIYIPHAVLIGGQIMRVYDPRVHVKLNLEAPTEGGTPSLFRQEEVDARWLFCRRPFVVTGGGPGNSTTFLSIDLVKMAVGQFDLGPAAAFSIMYFLVILLISWVFYTVMTNLDREENR